MARRSKLPCVYAAFRFHTTQANASISASTRKRKVIDPCACAYAFHGEISALMLAPALASLVKTRLASTSFLYWTRALRLSNDPCKVDSNFLCYAATGLSPHRNVIIFTQRMHKPTGKPLTQ